MKGWLLLLSVTLGLVGAAAGGRDWDGTEAKALIAGLLRQAGVRANDPVQRGVHDK